jgi:hypothetical protein
MNQLSRVVEVNEVTADDFITVYIEQNGQIVLRKIKTSNAFNGQTLIPNVVFVSEKSDFPTPVAGVVTLLDGYTYIITTTVDLTGDRLVCGGVVNLFGTSSETSYLTSTGLGVGVPLITSIYTVVLRYITFHDVDTCYSIDGNTNLVALDWIGVNWINVPNVGEINTCDNFILETCAFLGANGMTFTGTIGTIGVTNSLFRGIDSVAIPIIEVQASCTITRRFRILFSSIISLTSNIGVAFSTSALVPIEGYILQTVNFSGNGTYQTGVTAQDNKALFEGCRGVENSGSVAQYYMNGNVTSTEIATQNVFVKAAGTTTAGTIIQRFSHTNNRATYIGALAGIFKVTISVSATSGNNQSLRFRVAKNGTTIAQSEVQETTSGVGRSQTLICQDLVSLVTNDFIELWVANGSTSQNITVENLNVIIEKLN